MSLPNNDAELISLIETSFQGSSTELVQNTSKILNELCKHESLVARVIGYLMQPTISDHVKISCAVLIKKFSYQYSLKDLNKNAFVQKLYQIIMEKNQLSMSVKQTLGVALQYIFNHDQNGLYRNNIIIQLLPQFESPKYHEQILNIMIIMTTYLNSLVQIDQQIKFFQKINPIFIKIAKLLLNYLQFHPKQSNKLITIMISMFNFYQLALSRLIDQQDQIIQQIKQIRQYPQGIVMMFEYLFSFHNKNSIISLSIPMMNPLKQIIMQIVYQLYRLSTIPQKIFQLIYMTFILESNHHDESEATQHIISRCLEILENLLIYKKYYDTFLYYKMETLFALIMYSTTKQDQLNMLSDQPDKFVEIAQEYSQAFSSSPIVKVRAACLLKAYVTHIDQATRNTLEIIIVLMTSSLQPSEDDSNVLNQIRYTQLIIRNQLRDEKFFELSATSNIETSLLMLTVLAPVLNTRDDLIRIVYALLVTHMDKFVENTQSIILIRLVRMLGYYPTAIYYNFIKQSMCKGQAFILQGVKTFQKIIKQNRYPEVFDLLSQILAQLIDVIEINDHLFEIILLSHYQKIVIKSEDLFIKSIEKIRNTFANNFLQNQHRALICMNYIESMLKKEQDNSRSQKIEKIYLEMQQCLFGYIGPQKVKVIEFYEDKIINIYLCILQKYGQITQSMCQYGKYTLEKLTQYHKGSLIFKFYNHLLLKLNNNFIEVNLYYQKILQEFKRLLQNGDPNQLQILPYYAFLLGQIVVSFHHIYLNESQILFFFEYLNHRKDIEDQQPWICNLLLQYLYIQPNRMCMILKQHNIYESSLKTLMRSSHDEKFQLKIYLLAMTKLLQVEENYFQDILLQCIKYMKIQISKNKVKVKKVSHDYRTRKILSNRPQKEEEQRVNNNMDDENDNYMINYFIGFRHPFDQLNQFDMFKIRIWQNIQIVNTMNQQQKTDIREILQTDWVNTKTRRILHIFKP